MATLAGVAVPATGTSVFVAERDAGCLEPFAAVPETQVVTAAPGADVITKIGKITSGVFVGRSARAAPTTDLPLCLSERASGGSPLARSLSPTAIPAVSRPLWTIAWP